jgi:hypothetical protein
VLGVAPRFAVAVPLGPKDAALVIADGSPCPPGPVAGSLGCLRALTAALVAGPALITYPSARSGTIIQLGVHVRDRSLRRRVVFGVDTLLQRREGAGWRSIFHMPYPLAGVRTPPAPVAVGTPGYAVPAIGFTGESIRLVQLPLVTPGQYRVAKQVSVGSRRRWLFASLRILDPPPPPCTNCPHG